MRAIASQSSGEGQTLPTFGRKNNRKASRKSVGAQAMDSPGREICHVYLQLNRLFRQWGSN